MPRRALVQTGDVFTLPVDDERCGLGQALLVNTGTYNLYVAIYHSLHLTSTLPDPTIVTSDDVALIGGTMDALIYHKRWNVIGNTPIDRSRFPWPSFVVQIRGTQILESFDGIQLRSATDADMTRFDRRWSRAPIAFQNAFSALHGIGEWKDSFDKLTVDHAQRTTLPVA